jgi:hypothetical protein
MWLISEEILNINFQSSCRARIGDLDIIDVHVDVVQNERLHLDSDVEMEK